MHDAGYLRARARHLRAVAATSRDPEIARSLREVAGDFDTEARREESRQDGVAADGDDTEGTTQKGTMQKGTMQKGTMQKGQNGQ